MAKRKLGKRNIRDYPFPLRGFLSLNPNIFKIGYLKVEFILVPILSS